MAGIDSLIKGAVGTLAKDKMSQYLSPSQLELARFAMSPQAYLADKGITAVANLLGYGNQYQELKAGAEDNKEYGKQIIRDTIGDALPTAVGDLVRATPRGVDEPAGTYTAFDPETQTYTQQGSANPVATGTSATFEDFMRDLNAGDTQSVGPLEEYDQKRLDAEYDFGSDFSDYLGKPNGDNAPIDFGGTMGYGDMFGGGGKGFERDMEYGGGFNSFLQAEAYKRGGEICGCKR